MKIIPLVLILLCSILKSSAQTGLFAKNRRINANGGAPYAQNTRPDTKMEYFVGSLLKNDTSKTNQYLATGINLNASAVDGGYESILTYAIKNCNTVMLVYLINHGADPNLRIRKTNKQMFSGEESYEFSHYPLEAAAEIGDMQKMDVLLKYGADINRCTDGIQQIATTKGNMALMKYIGNKTGHSSVEKNTLAVMTNHSFEHDASKVTPETIDDLIKGGADVNAVDENGYTALINVITNEDITNKEGLINALLKHKANPNKSTVGRQYPLSPLKAAVRSNRIELVKLLVENGADINQRDRDDTPLTAAKLDEIKEYLILHGGK